ncbi:MAG: YbaB/EbfC family nucleoid-associated protein [Planctomycetota bacterium]
MRGGLGGFDVGKMMKQAQGMQKEMLKVQEELKERVVEASAGGGMVTVHINGQQELLSVKIDPEVFKSGDVSMLEDLMVAAVLEGMKKSKDLAQLEMNKITGGLGANFPGLV